MAIPFNFELFKKRLNLFLEKIEDLGGEVEPLTIEKPATEDEIKAVEAKLGYTLPPHFREVLLENTAHLEFYWDVNDVTIEDESIIPDALDYEEHRKEWAADVFPNYEDPEDRIWYNKLCFHINVNGDYIAIELEPENYGKVVYLSHDGASNLGTYLADNFKEFLMNYASVGCTGGEDWQWEPFYTAGKGIDPTSENAQAWCKLLNIDEKELDI